ncbi:MAG: hypothetical protein GX874_03135 [Smithella sp.]|nr:hypothetical protein [Smithella sp.]
MHVLSRVSTVCIAVTAMAFLTGCSKKDDNWLVGEWAFDQATTRANLPADIKAQGVPDSLAIEAGKRLTDELIGQVVGTKMLFTATTVTFTHGNGNRESAAYKITGRPDADTLVIKDEDGDESTFSKSGKYLCIPTTGAIQLKMYFQPI